MRHTIIYILIIAIVAAGCQSSDAPYNPQPLLSVADATDITRNDAIIHGTITDNGGKGLSDLHFEWWQTDGTPSSSPLLTTTDGEVAYALHDLIPGRTYCFQLKGGNGRVTVESDTKQFTTQPNVVPVISTLTTLAKGPASLIASFMIEDNGGEDIIEAGCHIRDINSGNTTKHTEDIKTISDNMVYLTIRGLKENADLEITPFATNTIGETQGTPIIITTSSSIYVSQPGMLEHLIGDGLSAYSSLSFSGSLNGDDIRTLRAMSLTAMDLTDANIVEGGGNYIPSRYTNNDVVGFGMFQDLNDLKSIQLPNSVTTIEEQAFRGCTSLPVITIPANVTSLSPSDGCTALKEINVSSANRNFKSIDGVLFNADATGILWFPLGKEGEYALPPTVTAIGDYAFRNCHITRFTMADNITQIGKAVFTGSSVQSVTLSDKLSTIPQATFQSCTGLTEVHLGSATDLIGSYAFDGCPLTDIYLSATVPPVCNSNTFTSSYDLLKLCRLHVPEGSIARYRNHPTWGKFEYISK